MRNLKTLTLGLALAIVPSAAYSQTSDMNKAEANVQFTKAPEVSNVGSDSVKISWSTNSASSGKIQYRPTSGGDWKTASATASNGQKDFTATLSGLESGKTYEYQLVSNSGYVRHRGQFAAGGSSAASNSGSSTASSTGSSASSDAQQRAEAAVQITTGPTVTVDSTGTNATIKWTTNNVAANQVQYRPTSGGSWKNAYDRQGSRDHNLQLTGLQPNATYEYKILTRDGDTRMSGQFQSSAGATSSASTSSTGATASANTTGAAGTTASGTKVPLYRGVNSSNNAHVFSTSQSSFPSGFSHEGVVGFLMTSQVSGTAPLYALSNASTGDYLYTTDTNERPSAQSQGYTDKGILGYISTTQQSGTAPLYRMVDVKTNHHFYTADPNEHASVLSQGFKDEGVAGYVFQQ